MPKNLKFFIVQYERSNNEKLFFNPQQQNDNSISFIIKGYIVVLNVEFCLTIVGRGNVKFFRKLYSLHTCRRAAYTM